MFHPISIIMTDLIHCSLLRSLFMLLLSSLPLEYCVILLIKQFALNTNNDFVLCSLVKFSAQFKIDYIPLVYWFQTCLCRCGVSLSDSQCPLRALVCRRPAGLPGKLGSDGDTGPAVGGVLWRLCQLCSRLVGWSDCPVRRRSMTSFCLSQACSVARYLQLSSVLKH